MMEVASGQREEGGLSLALDQVGDGEAPPSESGMTRHASDPLQWSMDAFIRDRFRTRLEDPDTGRKVR